MHGIVLIHKAPGISSFKALYPIKKQFPKKTKIGHTGTLDPFAEGLLVVLCGSFTRLTEYSLQKSKRYIADIQLGQETDSLDSTGAIIKSKPVPPKDEILQRIPELHNQFSGNIQQIPPAYSAIHIQGKRAYERARAGEIIEMPSRQITIHSIDIQLISDTCLRCEVECSSGTYIRSLARDIAVSLNTCGHVKNLIRTHIGDFSLKDAVVAENAHKNLRSDIQMYTKLTGNQAIYIQDEYLPAFIQGKIIQKQWFIENSQNFSMNEHVGVFDSQEKFIGQIQLQESKYRYDLVIPQSRGDQV